MKACRGWYHCMTNTPRGTAANRYLWSVKGLRAGEIYDNTFVYKYVLGLGTKVQTLVHLLCIQNLISSFEDSLHVHFNACTCTLRAAKSSECSNFHLFAAHSNLNSPFDASCHAHFHVCTGTLVHSNVWLIMWTCSSKVEDV